MPTATTLPRLETYPNAQESPAFVVHYQYEGEVYVVGFDSIYELTTTLVNESVDGRLTERIIDFVEESFEAATVGDVSQHDFPPLAEYCRRDVRTLWECFKLASAFSLAALFVYCIARAMR